MGHLIVHRWTENDHATGFMVFTVNDKAFEVLLDLLYPFEGESVILGTMLQMFGPFSVKKLLDQVVTEYPLWQIIHGTPFVETLDQL